MSLVRNQPNNWHRVKAATIDTMPRMSTIFQGNWHNAKTAGMMPMQFINKAEGSKRAEVLSPVAEA